MTSTLFSRWTRTLAVAVLTGTLLSGCGYNAIQQKDEAVKASSIRGRTRVNRRMAEVPGGLGTEHATVRVKDRPSGAAPSAVVGEEALSGSAGRVGWLGGAASTSM